MFKGAITAAITPFKNSRLDLDSMQNHIVWQYEQGIKSIVISGCTGESSSLTHDEKNILAEVSVEVARKYHDLRIILGVVSSSTEEAVMLSQKAEMIGVDGLMVMCPAYNKPNQRGLYNHFKAINDSVSIPIMIYNSPSRTGVNMSDETISSLSMLKNINAVKDSTGDLERPITLRSMLNDDSDFNLLGADDILALSFNANGGDGCVSVASNIIPEKIKKIQDLTLSGDFRSAYEVHKTLVPIYLSMFCETNPVPVKYAAFIMGKISSPEVRSPMMELTPESKLMVENALKDLT